MCIAVSAADLLHWSVCCLALEMHVFACTVAAKGYQCCHLQCRGFGTVRYASKEDAEAAVEAMNNAQIGGRTVTVRIDRYA